MTQSLLSDSRRVTDALTEQLTARIELGQFLKRRRQELGLAQIEIAEALGWEQGSYAEIERGSRSSDNAASWLKMADSLQLSRRDLLARAWKARQTLPVRLPPTTDDRRDMILDLVISQFSTDDPLSIP